MVTPKHAAALSVVIALSGCSLPGQGHHSVASLIRRSIEPDGRTPTIAYPSRWHFRYIYAKCSPFARPIAALSYTGLDATWWFEAGTFGSFSHPWSRLPGKPFRVAGRSAKLLIGRPAKLPRTVSDAPTCSARTVEFVLAYIRMKRHPALRFSVHTCAGGRHQAGLTREVVAMVKSIRNVP